MSAGTSTNVTTGKRTVNGGIYVAPAGTTLPTNATAALAAAFVNLGYISEDGVKNKITKTKSQIKEWGGETVAKPQTSQEDSWTYKLLETLNVAVLKYVFGDENVTESSGSISTIVNANSDKQCVIVVDMAQAGGKIKRVVIPRSTIDDIEEISYNGTDAAYYGLTVGAMFDETINGTHAEYIGTPSTPAPGGGESGGGESGGGES